MRRAFSRRAAAATFLLAGFMGTVFVSGLPHARATEDRPVTSRTADSPTNRPPNRLIHATSPYLLQHAHNPVDWYSWGPEAFQRARAEDKPIFLSIGYAACHWCHVMERESFENPDIARLLNENFVCIKVDREERPDLDDIYMNATLVYNRGQGGWPMSVFLTPDQKPFFTGTYFPPESRWGRPGFREVLQAVAKAWDQDRDRITQSAEALTDAVRRIATATAPANDGLSDDHITQAVSALAQAFDRQRGGLLSDANKFPPALGMSLMLREYLRTAPAGRPDKHLLELVELTLDHLARGGIYDHLAGGIARYSTDPEWLVPHFEKMLYDQALVSSIYLETFQVTNNRRWADVAADILDYVLRDLRSDQGGFYSSRDADSEGVEGRYYVWTRSEILSILGPQAGELFCSYYDVTDAGNWESKNILNIQRPMETVARLHNIDPDALRKTLADARVKLLAVRDKRVPPGLDDKILTGWNGLIISSLARAGRLLDQPRYTAAAEQAADFILANMTDSGRLLRTYRSGRVHTPGFLDDYAFFVEGLLDLYETTFDKRWLTEAARLTDDMIARFWDPEHGAFFTTAVGTEPLIVRAKDTRDGSIPAGNSVALMNLLRLAHMLDRADLHDKADRNIQTLAGRVGDVAYGSERLLSAILFARSQPREIVIVGQPSKPETAELLRAINLAADFNRVVLLLDPTDPDAAEWQQQIPPLRNKLQLAGQPTAFVCRNRTCSRPVTTPDDLTRLLQPPPSHLTPDP